MDKTMSRNALDHVDCVGFDVQSNHVHCYTCDVFGMSHEATPTPQSFRDVVAIEIRDSLLVQISTALCGCPVFTTDDPKSKVMRIGETILAGQAGCREHDDSNGLSD